MKSICLFVGYTQSNHEIDLPLIAELKRHFDEVLLLTNIAPVGIDVDFLLLSNIGYDFGFVYQALSKLDLKDCDFLAVVNNSQLLLDNKNLDAFFDWCHANDASYCGLTDAFQLQPVSAHVDGYHIQSSFLVFKGEAVSLFVRFFEEIDFEFLLKISNGKHLRQAVIDTCEVGLTRYMIERGQKTAAWFNAATFNPKHGMPVTANMHVKLWEALILAGYPFMKKKISSGLWDLIIPNPKHKYRYFLHGKKNSVFNRKHYPHQRVLDTFMLGFKTFVFSSMYHLKRLFAHP